MKVPPIVTVERTPETGAVRWSRASVALHWLAAIVVVGMIVGGLTMSSLPPESAARLLVSRLHTVFGATLVALMIIRLVVRRRGQAPAPLALGALHRRGVQLVHGLIYVVVIAIGVTGGITAATSAWPDYIGGRLAEAPVLRGFASREAHEILAFTLVALVAIHVVGVMLHQLRHGRTLRRMLPF